MGFPQGSILGPLFFFLYVNDFNNCLTKSKAIMFADDTTVWTSHKNTSTLFQLMQSEMELIDRWLVSNKLSINIEKTKFMFLVLQTQMLEVNILCQKEIDKLIR